MHGEFNRNGTIYSRGEKVAKFREGDRVFVLKKFPEDLVMVLMLEGELEGQTVIVEENLITYHK
jgi:NADPH:quinone reductase-like Zn-dependent oxidoreductase